MLSIIVNPSLSTVYDDLQWRTAESYFSTAIFRHISTIFNSIIGAIIMSYAIKKAQESLQDSEKLRTRSMLIKHIKKQVIRLK